jgi:PKD repeat protein
VIANAGGYNSVGDMQIGPDNKIYCAINGGSYLAVINDPNALGTGCDFELNGVYLGGHTSGIGLPATLVFGNCAINAQVLLAASSTTLCQKFCIDFVDNSTNNPTAWLWLFDGGSPTSSTDQNPAHICYNAPGEYDVTLITTNANGNDTLTLPGYITVYSTPPFPSIAQVGYTLTSSLADAYQWQLNAVDIPGATDQSYTVQQSGTYTVIITDANGCQNSFSTYVLISGIDESNIDAGIYIFPNPVNDELSIQASSIQMNEATSISIVNVLGQKVLQENFAWKNCR